jgi:Domain of unknown function (DUF4268)
MTLGLLVSVDVRDVWPHEANDFTPWLAEDENIAILGQALELGDLEVEATERAVGRFSADIVARDDLGKYVLIENQLEDTDHRHLGQLLTYLAGLEGDATIIWIAKAFLEEHRAAVDWLNANTSDRFNFFGVEIELFRIGDSKPAPRFNVVAKPNKWSRSVRSIALSSGNGASQLRQAAYNKYWTSFRDYIQSNGADFSIRTPPRQHWCGFGIGRQGFTLNTSASLSQKWISVHIWMSRESAKQAFDLLLLSKTEIHTELGFQIDWQRLPERKGCAIVITKPGIDPSATETQNEQYSWLLDTMRRFQRVFKHRIAALELDGSLDDESSLPLDGNINP